MDIPSRGPRLPGILIGHQAGARGPMPIPNACGLPNACERPPPPLPPPKHLADIADGRTDLAWQWGNWQGRDATDSQQGSPRFSSAVHDTFRSNASAYDQSLVHKLNSQERLSTSAKDARERSVALKPVALPYIPPRWQEPVAPSTREEDDVRGQKRRALSPLCDSPPRFGSNSSMRSSEAASYRSSCASTYGTSVSGGLSPNTPESPMRIIKRVPGLYICECCPKKPKKFESEMELNVHASEKQYACSYCPNRFKNKNEAERHQNSLHLRRHSWSCAALTGLAAAFHYSSTSFADICGYCGEEFRRTGADNEWSIRVAHLQDVHKFGECNQVKKFFRADHFRQHLKHSHAGTSGKWTNMLENACMREEPLPEPIRPPERLDLGRMEELHGA